MEFFFYFIAAGAALTVIGIFSNKLRSQFSPNFELTPNCLLTRKAILFLTGKRSVFYFESYWNFFPIYLAEHGYEIFHLRLPWSHTEARRERVENFLKSQDAAQRSYHLVLDAGSFEELKQTLTLNSLASIQSVTVLTREGSEVDASLKPTPFPTYYVEMAPAHPSFLSQLSFTLHTWVASSKQKNHLGSLGYYQPQNAQKLLAHAQMLAEQDLISS